LRDIKKNLLKSKSNAVAYPDEVIKKQGSGNWKVAKLSIFENLDGSETSLSKPQVYVSNPNGEVKLVSGEFASFLNMYSIKDDPYSESINYNQLRKRNFVDLNNGRETIVKFSPGKKTWNGVAWYDTMKNKQYPKNGSYVILNNGKKAIVKYATKTEVTLTPIEAKKVNGQESLIQNKPMRNGARMLNSMVRVMRLAFPNIQIEIVDNHDAPIGQVKDGVVYMNAAKIQYDTPIHELGHIFNTILKKADPEAYMALEKQAEEILFSNSEISKKVREKYSHKSKEDMVEEMMATIIGFNSADTVERFLEKMEARTDAQKLWDNIRLTLKEVWGSIKKLLANAFGIQAFHVNQIKFKDKSLGEISNILTDLVLSGKTISYISSNDLLTLNNKARESVSLSNETIKTTKDMFDNFMSFEDKSDRKRNTSLLKLSNDIINNNGYIPDYWGEREFIGTDLSDPKIIKKLNNIIKKKANIKKTLKKNTISLHDKYGMQDKTELARIIFGTFEHEYSGEQIANYTAEEIMVLAKALRFDGNSRLMSYSDLKKNKDLKHLYDPVFEGYDPLIKITVLKNGEIVASLFDMVNYSMEYMEFKSMNEGILAKHLSESEIKRSKSTLKNTEKSSRTLGLGLLRNKLISLGVQVEDLGIVEFAPKYYDYHDIDQQSLNSEISAMGKEKKFTDNLSNEIKDMFSDRYNIESDVNYFEKLMSSYENAPEYKKAIYNIWQIDESSKYDIVKALKQRLSVLLKSNGRSISKDKNPIAENLFNEYELAELDMLRKSITQLERVASIYKSDRKVFDTVSRYMSDMNALGPKNVQLVVTEVKTSNRRVIRRYDDYMKGLKGKKGVFREMFNKSGKKLSAYGYNVSEEIFESLAVIDTDIDGKEFDTGHIYWTTDEELDPLYAKKAQEKLRSNPSFQETLDYGKQIVEAIDKVMYDVVKHKMEISDKRFDVEFVEKKLSLESRTRRKIKSSGYKRGMIPVMGINTSAYIARKGFKSIPGGIKKLWGNVSSRSRMYDDMDGNVYDDIDNTFEMADLFLDQFGLDDKGNNSNRGNVKTRLKRKLGLEIVNADPNDVQVKLVDKDEVNDNINKDLEDVLGYFFMSMSRLIEYEQSTIPFLNGMKVLMEDQEINRKINNENNIKFVDDYRKQAMHNSRTKLGPGNLDDSIDKSVSFATSAASFMVMTLNFNVGVLSAIGNGLNANIEGLTNSIFSKITGSDYRFFSNGDLMKAHKLLLTDWHKMLALADTYNVIAGMPHERVGHRYHQETKKYLFSNFYSNIANFGTDTVARMLTMTAQMLHDGTWDAHTFNKETGGMEYDATKDKRYSEDGETFHETGKLLAENKTERLIMDGYQAQDEGEVWNGVQMPIHAYDDRDGEVLRYLADRYVVGAYSDETKSAMGNFFAGKLYDLFHRYAVTKIKNAFQRRKFNDEGGRYIVTKLVDAKTGEETQVVRWENVEMEGYFKTLIDLGYYTIKYRDWKHYKNLSQEQKRNLLKMMVNFGIWLSVSIIYSKLVGDDWDDAEDNDKIPPYRLLKNVEYGLDSLFSILIIIDLIKDPFVLTNIVGRMFEDQYGRFTLKNYPFSGQVRSFKEMGLMFSDDPIERKKAEEKFEKKRREEIAKTRNRDGSFISLF